jgi:hypothetical protein
MTDGIIKELNAAAPPGSLDTNAPATSSSNNATNPSSPIQIRAGTSPFFVFL